MTNVVNLSAHLSTDTAQFESGLRRAQTALRQAETRLGAGARAVERNFATSFQRSAQSVAVLDGPLGGVAGRLSSLATVARTSGLALGAFGIGIGGLVLAMRRAVNVGEGFERSALRTEALLRATGVASGQTAEGIRAFSRDLAGATLAGTQAVEVAAQRLMTFRRVSGETFTRALRRAQDLAELGFGTLESSATTLGRALEDPVNGLTALSRLGIRFTESQRDMIRSLVEAGDHARAQGLILDELQRRVGGAGEAAAGGLSGAYDTLSQRVQEFFEALNRSTGAGSAMNAVLRRMADEIGSVTTALDPGMISGGRHLDGEREKLDRLSGSLRDLVRARADAAAARASGEAGRGAVAPEMMDMQVEAAYRAVQAQRALVQEIERTATAKEEEARELGEAEQVRMAADEAAARQRRAAAAAAAAEARRQQQIAQTIEALQLEREALIEQHYLYEVEGRSLEEATVARQVLEAQRRLGIDAASEEGQAIERLIEQRSRTNQLIAEETQRRARLEAQIARATAIIGANRTAQERFNDELAELNELMEVGAFGHGAEAAEQYARAVEAARKQLERAKAEMSEGERAAEDFTRTLSSGIEDAILQAERLTDVLRGVGQGMARMFLRSGMNALEPVVTSALVSVAGGIGIPGFHDGGHPPLGKISVVGERGPELFVPHTRGTIISNEDLNRPAGGGGPTIYADMRGASLEAVQRLERFVGELNGSIEQRAVGAMVSARQTGRLRDSFR